jgi:isopentenyldiphosphate isomerase
MSYLDRIRECNARNMARYRPFVVGGAQMGWVRADMAERLSGYPDVFAVNADAVGLDPALRDCASRTPAVERVLRAIDADGGLLHGWRDERYPVVRAFGETPALLMERAAVPLFGVRAFGLHLNGYVDKPAGLHMWIARRARDKPTYPGMLDNMVAGGQPFGLTLAANLAKECAEEAGIPAALAARAIPVSAISYCAETAEGLRPDVQFCYDLELDPAFTPVPHDDEIESFLLLPIGEVAALVRETREFKFNCNLVIIDFLVRHGLIAPEDPDYLAIVQGLHQGNSLSSGGEGG